MNVRKNSLGYCEFVLPILEVAQPQESCTVKHYVEVSEADIDSYSKVILSGTPLKDSAAPRQIEKFRWLKTTDKPVLGICAGMQVLGVVFSSKLVEYLEIGMTQIATLKENPLFSGEFKAYSLHNYCLEPSGEFEVLAKSANCVQAIKHKQKPLYGILFHPEVRNPEILKRFLSLKQ
ncbi:MAG: gamma-glutamyl-gamma-aminobutyrate hydrolase family protein [Candidatus Bathyarchaeota archaeon]|nr:gamma-glutamyl-gamma-aminobutyrate hydrolase family protein [Candidatus Bathyarchaeota archaeon]